MKIFSIYNSLKNINFQKKVNLIVYNDSHGSIKHIDSFIEEQDKFYKQNPDGINLTLCGGDLFLDESPNNEIVAQKIAKVTDAIAVGNHDVGAGNYLAKLIDKFDMLKKWHSINIRFKKETPLEDKIIKSSIIEKRDEKIGIIGISPFDFGKNFFKNNKTDFITMTPLNQTIEAVKKEVKNLKELGINIIFLLAHTGELGPNGENYYEEFAKIGEIDVIIGGHDHREINKWTTSRTGDPVKIIATGRSPQKDFGENLDIISKLILDFDDKGVLNKEKTTTSFVNLKEDNSTKIPIEIIRKVETPLIKGDALRGHSEIGNLVADSNLWYVNNFTNGEKADFAFVNPGTIRANFDNPNITSEDIQSALPFISQTLIKTSLTKKQILETLEWCVKSTTLPKVSPGVMQVSNMEYTINPDLTVSNVHILNNDGTIKYYLDNCDDTKSFTAVYDTFLATGILGLTALAKNCENNPNVEIFGEPRQKVLKEYLSKVDKLMDYKKIRIYKK